MERFVVAALLTACTPHVHVSVEASTIDHDHPNGSWYVVIDEDRSDGYGKGLIAHRGVVCGDRPAAFSLPVRCGVEATFSGEVWRLPDTRACARVRPPTPASWFEARLELPIDVEFPGAKRIAVLVPQTIYRGHRLGHCGAGGADVKLWPPIDEGKLQVQLWENGWLGPEDGPFVVSD